MAYLNFAEAGGVEIHDVSRRPAVEAGFSALEWSVIAIARLDGLASLKEPSRVARAMGSLFGTWKNPRLADGRLEALRRMAVLAWHNSYVVPLSAVRAFKDAGFTIDQYETLQASISRGRIRNGRRSG